MVRHMGIVNIDHMGLGLMTIREPQLSDASIVRHGSLDERYLQNGASAIHYRSIYVAIIAATKQKQR